MIRRSKAISESKLEIYKERKGEKHFIKMANCDCFISTKWSFYMGIKWNDRLSCDADVNDWVEVATKAQEIIRFCLVKVRRKNLCLCAIKFGNKFSGLYFKPLCYAGVFNPLKSTLVSWKFERCFFYCICYEVVKIKSK